MNKSTCSHSAGWTSKGLNTSSFLCSFISFRPFIRSRLSVRHFLFHLTFPPHPSSPTQLPHCLSLTALSFLLTFTPLGSPSPLFPFILLEIYFPLVLYSLFLPLVSNPFSILLLSLSLHCPYICLPSFSRNPKPWRGYLTLHLKDD